MATAADIVVGNWGRNSKYEYSYTFEEPLGAYSDFDKNGVVDIVEYHRTLTGKWCPNGRSCSTRAMPFIGNATSLSTLRLPT